MLNGIFWVLRTGARWSDLPDRYPPHQTCHRRFMRWSADGTLATCLKLLADHLQSRFEAPSQRAGGGATTFALEQAPTVDGISAVRSWRWHTALLLQSPLARQFLGEQGQPQIAGAPARTSNDIPGDAPGASRSNRSSHG